MDYRQLGGSGLQVPVLTFGTCTWGGSGLNEATRLVDICL